MALSIIKVEGLSMNPFFRSGEYLLCMTSSKLPQIGDCILHEKNIHRYIGVNNIKGDRLLYSDPSSKSDHLKTIVLGRLVSKENQTFIFTDHQHPILKFLSRNIATLSRHNIPQNKLRLLNIGLIFIIAKIHRALEHFLKKIQEIK